MKPLKNSLPINAQHFAFFIILFLFFGCSEAKKRPIVKQQVAKPLVIFQPLNKFNSVNINELKEAVVAFYPIRVQLAPIVSMPQHLYYAPGKRYRADRIIDWLASTKADSVTSIVGLTDLDISTTLRGDEDFGIMGFGHQEGLKRSCVVSTMRPAKTAKNKAHLQQRVYKLVIHELGHNFGLSHCPNSICFMRDAGGKIRLDEQTDLCASCRKKLKI